MAADQDADNLRHLYGPRPIGALLPKITRPVFRRRAPAAAQLLADWPAIIGPAIAAVTQPQRFTAGTLTIACAGPVALELQHLSGELLARINTHLGRQTVERLRFVQTAPASPSAVPARKIDPRAAARAESAVAALPEGELRDALAALGRRVLGRG